MLDKKQLENMYKRSLKVKKVLFILSMVFFGVATAFLVAYIVLTATGKDVLLIPDLMAVDFTLRMLFIDVSMDFLSAGVVCILFSFLIFARRARLAKYLLDDYDRLKGEEARGWTSKPSAAPIVDVKPAEEQPKGKYDDLLHEYEKLYEKGYITKEELDNKRKELLN